MDLCSIWQKGVVVTMPAIELQNQVLDAVVKGAQGLRSLASNCGLWLIVQVSLSLKA